MTHRAVLQTSASGFFPRISTTSASKPARDTGPGSVTAGVVGASPGASRSTPPFRHRRCRLHSFFRVFSMSFHRRSRASRARRASRHSPLHVFWWARDRTSGSNCSSHSLQRGLLLIPRRCPIPHPLPNYWLRRGSTSSRSPGRDLDPKVDPVAAARWIRSTPPLKSPATVCSTRQPTTCSPRCVPRGPMIPSTAACSVSSAQIC